MITKATIPACYFIIYINEISQYSEVKNILEEKTKRENSFLR